MSAFREFLTDHHKIRVAFKELMKSYHLVEKKVVYGNGHVNNIEWLDRNGLSRIDFNDLQVKLTKIFGQPTFESVSEVRWSTNKDRDSVTLNFGALRPEIIVDEWWYI